MVGRPIRHATVKQQPVKRVRSSQVPTYHAHQCTECRRRYSDRCDQGRINARCMTCTHGHPLSKERQDRMPKDCCKAHSKLMTDADNLTRYALAGDGAWWQCVGPHGCFRTHPNDPTKEPA